jgi:riboflavin transporter FmnP
MNMKAKPLVSAGILVALGVLIPVIFHVTGVGGTIFLPMHIPVLFAGIILGPGLGALVGLLCPVLSHLLTGMPPVSPMPIMPLMVVELAVYGAVMGFLTHRIRSIWVSLVGAMVLGRVALGLAVAVIAPLYNVPLQPLTYVQGAIASGLPGIVIQLLLIPPVAQRFFLSRANKGKADYGLSLGEAE